MDGIYLAASNVLEVVINKKRSLRNAIYENNCKRKKHLLRLCCETLRYKKFIDSIIKSKKLNILQRKLYKRGQYLVHVLLYEFVFGSARSRRNIQSGLLKFLCDAQNQIDSRVSELSASGFGPEVCNKSGNMSLPRYARINTLKWSFEDALDALRDDEWLLKKSDSESVEFADLVALLKKNEFLIDRDIKDLVIFHPKSDLHSYWMVADGYLILQDKASCLPAVILMPKSNSHCFDTCAAPGMKTSHLSALLSNTGFVWATDKSPDRVKVMRKLVGNAGCKNVAIECVDFLLTDVNIEKYKKVQYVLVDPPCSGSGIVKRMDHLVDENFTVDRNRLRSLSNLQAMMLKHALKFPNVKKLVYSTCSLSEEENEKVIEEVISDEAVRKSFKLCHALPTWPNRGLASYSFGEKCLRSWSSSNLTNGFFVALLRRKKLK